MTNLTNAQLAALPNAIPAIENQAPRVYSLIDKDELGDMLRKHEQCDGLCTWAYDPRHFLEDLNSELIEHDDVDLPNAKDYILDRVSEVADSNVSIYYSDQEKWMQENKASFKYMGRVISEGLYDPSDYDLYSHIAAAWWLYNETMMNEWMEDTIAALALDYMTKKLHIVAASEGLIVAVLQEAENTYQFDRFGDVYDKVDELLADYSENQDYWKAIEQ